jgi:hypothetical protein
MSREEGNEPVSLGDGVVLQDSGRALLVELDSGDEVWIPHSVIHDDSEVYAGGNSSGDVAVKRWWAEDKGLA